MGVQSMVKLFGYCETTSRNERERGMLKVHKYRLYPNKTTADKLQWVLDRCRELYNTALQERRDAYELQIRRHPNYYDEKWRKQAAKELAISYYDQQNQLPAIK